MRVHAEQITDRVIVFEFAQTVQKRPAAKRPTAEEQIPFGDTGTFGKF